MGTYIIQGSDGRFYGPADAATLDQWASEGRILADTVLIDQSNNRQMSARDLPQLHHHFKFAPQPGVAHPTQLPYMPSSLSGPFIPNPLAVHMPHGYKRKRKFVAGLLAFIFGSLGLHRFYLGYSSVGILMLVLTLLGFKYFNLLILFTAVWSMLDLVSIMTGQMRDGNGFELD